MQAITETGCRMNRIRFACACVAVLILSACGQRQDANTEPVSDAPTQAPPPPRTPEELADQKRPASQSEILLYDQAFAAHRAAPNDIVAPEVDKVWNDKLCAALARNVHFHDWTGTVNTIRYNGFLEITFDVIHMDDIGIEPSSPLYSVIKTIKDGDPVLFSGDFDPGTTSCDVFSANPYIVHLTSIALLR